MAGGVGARAHVGGRERAGARRPWGRRSREVLRARDAALPERRAAHRSPEELRARRRDRALPPPDRPARAAPDGLRRVRPARREQRDQDRRPPEGRDRPVDRRLPPLVPPLGDLDRLEPGARYARAVVLPLDPVDLPEAVRARPRLPQERGGQVVPPRPDGAGQRAGDRRAVRAVRPSRRDSSARAVVLPDHRLRGPPARRPRHDRVARAREGDAAQLDRPQRRGGGRVPMRGAQDRLPGVHDAPRHAVRCDVLRDGARAPGRVQAGRGHRARARGPRVRQSGDHGVRRIARRRRQAEDGSAARPHGHKPRDRRADPDVRLRLRPDGVRDRRDHGGAGARSARLRLREGVRPSDPAGRRARRRRGRSQRPPRARRSSHTPRTRC